ncbi:hypothetical protein GYMLUDRAFT_37794 [Collybiopsis luxurians FD-317 M1]|nr:hypothetical protein GYMLUDRAFT_37794 [Collybiopsis luxurians FD-317 M1]
MDKKGNENHSQSRPASQASNRPSPTQNPSKDNQSQSRPASQASNRPSSPAQNPPKDNQSQSRPASQASNRPSSPAQNPPKDNQSQASNRPSSPAQNPPSDEQKPSQGSPAGSPPGSRPASQASNKSRPASQASNRPQSQLSNKPNKSQSRTSSPSVSRPPPRSPRGRSRTPRSLSASSAEEDQPEESATQDRETTPIPEKRERELPDVEEERGEGDNAVETTDKGKDGEKKGKRRRRGKKRGFGVDSWPHGDNPGRLEPPHGVDDWPYGDEDDEGVGTSGRVLRRPKGVRDFSPAYEPSDAGSSAAGSDYSSVSGLSLGDWERSSLPGVDSWPYGDNPGIMMKPLDHWGKPLRNPDGSLMQKENPTGLPSYDELRDMDLDTHDDHVIKLKLEIDIDVAVEINARIHGDLTLALLM